jgi:molybdate transport system ATP-binding protein
VIDAEPRIDIALRATLRAGPRCFTLDVSHQCASDRLVIFGPSGSGKSLLLQAIAGLVRPETGHIRLGGRTLFDTAAGIDLPTRERRLGVVFQDYALFPHLDVRQNVGFGLATGAVNPPRSHRDTRVEDWLERFGLAAQAHQYPHQLSGGQKQRTALARALVGTPDALLLDEPFAALDPGLRRELRQELDALQRRLGIPLLLVTHDPEDAEALGADTLQLSDDNGEDRRSHERRGGKE